jgi:hypothetical protein
LVKIAKSTIEGQHISPASRSPISEATEAIIAHLKKEELLKEIL